MTADEDGGQPAGVEAFYWEQWGRLDYIKESVFPMLTILWGAYVVLAVSVAYSHHWFGVLFSGVALLASTIVTTLDKVELEEYLKSNLIRRSTDRAGVDDD